MIDPTAMDPKMAGFATGSPSSRPRSTGGSWGCRRAHSYRCRWIHRSSRCRSRAPRPLTRAPTRTAVGDQRARRGARKDLERPVPSRGLPVRGHRDGRAGCGGSAAERLVACGAEIRYHSRSAKEVAWTYDASPVELARASDVLVRADARRPAPTSSWTPRSGPRRPRHRRGRARRVRRRAARARVTAATRRRRAAPAPRQSQLTGNAP